MNIQLRVAIDQLCERYDVLTEFQKTLLSDKRPHYQDQLKSEIYYSAFERLFTSFQHSEAKTVQDLQLFQQIMSSSEFSRDRIHLQDLRQNLTEFVTTILYGVEKQVFPASVAYTALFTSASFFQEESLTIEDENFSFLEMLVPINRKLKSRFYEAVHEKLLQSSLASANLTELLRQIFRNDDLLTFQIVLQSRNDILESWPTNYVIGEALSKLVMFVLRYAELFDKKFDVLFTIYESNELRDSVTSGTLRSYEEYSRLTKTRQPSPLRQRL